NNTRTVSPPREASPSVSPSSLSPASSSPASSSGSALGGSPPPQVSTPQCPPPQWETPQVSRGHFSPSTPIFLRRARAHGAPNEIPLYLPHGQVLERTELCLVRPGGEGLASPGTPSPAAMAPNGCQDTSGTHRGPHPIGGKGGCSPDQELSPRAAGGSGEGQMGSQTQTGEEGGSELAEGKKLGLKKLALTQEQKSKLLDWNDFNPQSSRHSQKSAENGRGGRVLKPVRPLVLPRAARETLPAQAEAPEKRGTPAGRTPEERSLAPPRSPLRLIANALRRSLLEPLLSNSEGGRKAWAKPESRALPTSQPQACTRSFSLRKPSGNKDWDQQSPGRDMASRASAFFSLGTPPARAAQPSTPGLPDPALRTHSLPNRPSKMFPGLAPPPCSKMEDVPKLLEKVSLQETFPDASRTPKRKIALFSSLRLRDKSSEGSLQESRQRKDFRDLFSIPKGKVQPVDSARLGQRAPPPPEPDAKHPVTPVTGAASSTTSSSADEEFDPQFSLRSKERKTLRRRRKLEKATKQLVKQEELKRLHKAQAIQRQLEEVEERQRASEIQGVRLEKALRGEAADSGTQDEAQLLQEWFKLVLEKNKLMRYESELLIMAQELELEDHQSRLEQKLREKMLKEESQKDENDLNEEREIFAEMMQVIEQRDRLVDSLEEQRIREKAEDQRFESFIFSRGCQLSRT
uniref:BMERB domain-containing protein n=1 Tax=Myotis lucifugus TaxID=59463 RepID=G1Q452_MYOLU